MPGYRCRRCGDDHDELALYYGLHALAPRSSVPEAERDQRCFPSGDRCIIIDEEEATAGPVPEGPPAWEPPRFLRGIWDFLGDCCRWLVTSLVLPLLAGIVVALPISILACCVFYDAEWPMRILFGVCMAFFALMLPVLIGSIILVALVVLITASRSIGGLVRLSIGSPNRKPTSARREGEPAPGKAALWDHWLDGV
ncbi:hypothetical protein ElP_48650 [Tautonia plasticadhaerens]|uniref:Uncharacterized protein n=2 Tax=Tautonia plasticadhaerens TaxID=2527974 RepID=A0A518H7Z0_9BACT|nr:hypothetical protein ElP_48650 [Tautonia plasticadhaerens]